MANRGSMMRKGIKLACIGGGTGLSTTLRGLKKYTDNITAIVTVADNGGSSGMLRREMNILPPGDIRNCLLALAETEPMLEQLFQYRFKEGSMEGQNLGNLFIAALTDIYQHFGLAVEKANEVLRVKGKVVPVTLEHIQLKALYEDGTTMIGEHEIVVASKADRKAIVEVELIPKEPEAYSHVIEAIYEADAVILGPGSLFTSIIPNLLVKGVSEALKATQAKVIYVANLMTQPGETDNYTLMDHLKKIEVYLEKGCIDYVIANNAFVDGEVLHHYLEDGAMRVVNDCKDAYLVVEIPIAGVEDREHYIRHDADILARVIIDILE